MTTDTSSASDEANGFHLEPQVAKRFLVFSTGLWLGDRPFRARLLIIGFALAVALSILATDLIKDACKGLFDSLTAGETGVLWSAALLLVVLVAAGIGVSRMILRTHNEQARAWALTLGLGVALLLSTGITVALSYWNKWFFDALGARDVGTVKFAVLIFPVIIATMATIGVCIVLTRETLQVRWREWFVKRLLANWFADNRFHKLQVQGLEPPAPEYRIADDTRWATEILVDLGIGLFSALVGGLTFIFILWSVGGSVLFGGVVIPGYMVWLALIYGVTASLIMAYIGKPLVGRVGNKNEAEGHFRYAMMRVRGNAAAVIAADDAPRSAAEINRLYDTVVQRWLRMVKSHGHVTWITNASGPMIPILPLLFAAPKYLSGDLTLGQVTQLAFAFQQVQIAISWVVDNYNRIAEWYASARRVMDVVDACAAVADAPPFVAAPAPVTLNPPSEGAPTPVLPNPA
jgi:vitamin B12/bleomycin/antimicrobial peptide transport system ATP-binding/permease protein